MTAEAGGCAEAHHAQSTGRVVVLCGPLFFFLICNTQNLEMFMRGLGFGGPLLAEVSRGWQTTFYLTPCSSPGEFT